MLLTERYLSTQRTSFSLLLGGTLPDEMGKRWEDELCTEGDSSSCLMITGIPVMDGCLRGSKISSSVFTLMHTS